MNIKDIFAKGENGTLTYDQFKSLCEAEETKPKFADLSEGGYVSKGKYDDDINSKIKEIEGLNGTIATRDSDLEDLKTKLAQAGNDTEALSKLQGDLDALKSKYDTDTQNLNTQLKRQVYEYAVRDLANSKKFTSEAAKRDFVSQLKAKNFEVVDGKIFGGEDFVRQYQEQNEGAFVVDKSSDNVTNPKVPTFVQPTQSQMQTPNGFNFNFTGVRAHGDK